ncbi:MAG: hypothetical protein QUV05_12555 [Phycisphaerae bacterium]|nr:hypothetical protein [Phycisphaerae bacterium]
MRQKAGSPGTIRFMGKDQLARSRWFPELALFDDEAERKAVLKRLWRQLLRRKQYRLSLLAISVCSVFVLAFASPLARHLFPVVPHLLMTTLIGAAAGGCFGLAIQLCWRKPCQRYLREQLAAKGVPICIECGYDLRGQVDPRCPECGTAFDPKLIKPQEGSSTG